VNVRALCLISLMAGVGCGLLGDDHEGSPDASSPAPWDAGSVGNNAASKYPDISTLWNGQIVRTCGPNNGVCHHSLQFPDMQTQPGFLATINTRCNQIRSEPNQIDNLCEPVGDTLQIGSFSTEIGNVSPTQSGDGGIAMTADGGLASLMLTIKDPIPKGTSGSMSIVRQIAGLETINIPVLSSAVLSAAAGAQSVTLDYAPLTSKTKAPAPGGTVATFLYPSTWSPGNEDQVVMGDPNGDGIFGADLGGALVKPGNPMLSYLFLRLSSPIKVGPGQSLTNAGVPASNEAQMPIANYIYWDLDNSMVALWCWISGLEPDGGNAMAPIDYTNCDVSKMPQPVAQSGEATTWSSVYANILQSQCVTCHHTGTTYPTTLYMDAPLATYNTFLGIDGSGPSETVDAGIPYVTPGSPSESYLYLKITGASGIAGSQMPQGGQLSQAGIDTIYTWIVQGAQDD
jgi:hypothetical protein